MIKTIVGRPVTFLIIFLLVIGFGLYTSLDLPIDLYPEISPPILLVFTDNAGVGPEEMENSITRLLEGVLSNVGNIEKMTSVSSQGSSQITLQFVWGTDMSEAANEVRDKLEFIKTMLPEDASTPQIFKFDPSMMPILYLMVEGNRSPEELREIAENLLTPRLEQVDGVSLAQVMGGRDRAVRVEIPQNRLEAYGITMTQLAGMLRGQNVQISAGSIAEGNTSYLIQTSGQYRSIEEIRNTVIAYKSASGAITSPSAMRGPTAIRLRDIANVYDGFKPVQSNVFINGTPGVYLMVQKQSGKNSVKVADAVLERLAKIRQDLPRGVNVKVITDSTTIIRSSLKNVTDAILQGALLAVIILLIFLRSLKSTIVIAIAIPASVIITLMAMFLFGLTLNIMTLTGLALGIGMLVDNSIVILENIYRYREKGAKLTTAAILGSKEMTNAIVASTLTTIVVFAPVAIFKSQLGVIGELFSHLAFTVVFSLASSLVVALLVVPVLTSKYLPISARAEEPLKGILKKLDEVLGRFFIRMDEAYKNALRFVLARKKLALGLIGIIFVVTVGLAASRGMEFLPSSQSDSVTLNVTLPVGTRLELTQDVLFKIEAVVKNEIQGYKDIIITAGQKSFFGFLGSAVFNKGQIQITLKKGPERIDNSDVVKAKLRKHFRDFPAVVFSFGSGGGAMMGTSSPVDIILKTNDLVKGKRMADQIKDLLKNKVPEATEPSVNLDDGLPQVELYIDRDKAYDLGLNIYAIGQEIRANIDGVTASRFKNEGSEYDILVILQEQDRDTIPDLNRIFVVNSMGKRIPLASFTHLERTSGPVSIRRENQSRTIHITAGTPPGTDIGRLTERIRNLINAEIPADEAITMDFGGDWGEIVKYFFKILGIMLISVLLVFGIMAALFESFLDPFIVLFTIPLMLIGISLIYIVTGTNFDMYTLVGIIILVGIVVNNGIVLVDYTNLLRKRGVPLIEACIQAGGNRLRPVLMTTLTTILALLPSLIFKGDGFDLMQPITKTIFGGLTASTFFTLFLIPVLYAVFNKMSDKRKAKAEERRLKRIEARKAHYAGKGVTP